MQKTVRMSDKGIDTTMCFPAKPLRLSVSISDKGVLKSKQVKTRKVGITTRYSDQGEHWKTTVVYMARGEEHQIDMGGSNPAMTLAQASETHYELEREVEEHYRFPNNPLVVRQTIS